MERPYILHMLTPGRQMSPFDINMAADAGYQLLPTYTDVTLDGVAGLTQDAIFSRGPKGVARTGIFIGGRDVILAADMLKRAQKSMVPPFVVSLMADPSGSYTTAAAMVACVEAKLKERGEALAGQRILILGGTGTVGRIAAVLAARCGAEVRMSSRQGIDTAEHAAQETGARFGVTLHGISGGDREAVRRSLAEADVLLAVAAAGVQVVSGEDLAQAGGALKVAADVNAVPPEGVAGVGVMDDGKPLAGTSAVGIGALAVGNVKYQTQHRLLVRMRESDKPVVLGFDEAFEVARAVLAEKKS
ncbi:NAD(P)-dependent methylenetetrahydromethanopterin dehydrogenase [Rivibacter subsaxonicus]|uniref:Methylene-tetrahydromethanopterin dehydrogenase n=1 Tax=Rivibacter subsaxonicus TaxID=457575 RepID=A0A4Q7W1E5_9BURK|nr:NAD(P)-dependent methylenetetrahydromethanopterin dehydrogenase [Rivibacter subsaxonicus]RZU02728.1 methylene-tetrahydromethanopterin dehydrogenase [Rivibacter subsaxonicus]